MKSKILICILLVYASILCGCQHKQQILSTPTQAVSDDTAPTSYVTTAPTSPSTEPTVAPTIPPVDTIDNQTESPAPTEKPDATDVSTLPNRTDFVRVADYIPNIVCELPYASTNNFTGKVIYDFQDAYLRYGTVQKLSIVQDALREYGLSIKIWDAYRPQWAQVWLWNICPDPIYVSNPYQGKRTHCRGNTVDVTLVDMDGNEIPMPSGFDDFSARADRDYSDCTSEQKANSQLLESVLVHAGFKPYSGEWWHYTDEEDYDLELVFTPGEPMIWQPDCNEYITLRETPNTSATAITTIPKGEYFVILDWCDQFAFVDYHGQTGYVHTDYIMPLR